MRSSILVMLALCTPAAADGGYLTESIGGGAYQGELGRFSSGEARLQVGGGYVRGPWALEASATIYIPDFYYIDCYGDECLAAQAPPAGLVIANLDLRRAWRVLRPIFTRKIGLDMVLHGGPRWAAGETALTGYAGPGLGGGATLDLNLKLFSMFVDLGMDLALLRGSDGDVLTAKLPYVACGFRLGWM